METDNYLSLENLQQAISKMSNSKDLLSIKPTKIIIPLKIIKFLADQGYDTQEKINILINTILTKEPT